MALFCDFENVALGVREARYQQFDISKVLERLLLKGSIVVKKAYCDWERYREFKAAMHQAAFELIEIPHLRMSGKNSADIRMVVDALDLCYTKSHVDTFVIISGDSDFSPLVSKLRENAKTVIGVGVKNSTSELLISNCDEFIYYDDLVRTVRSPRRRTAAAASSSAAAPAGSSAAAPASSPAAVPVVVEPSVPSAPAASTAAAAASGASAVSAAPTAAASGASPIPGASPAGSEASPRRRRSARAGSGATATATPAPAPAPAAAPVPTEGVTMPVAGSGAAGASPAGAADAMAAVEADPDSVERRTRQALELVVDTLEALATERGEDEKIWGSMVKQALRRRKPGFSENYYGFRSFNRLLEEARDRGLIELARDEKSGGYTLRSLG
jgi:uncharacterized protein (TIGR00288 family)